MAKQEKQSFRSSIRKFGPMVLAPLAVLVACGLPAHGQQSAQSDNPQAFAQPSQGTDPADAVHPEPSATPTQTPDGKMQMPDGKMKTPDGKMQMPDGKKTPDQKMQMPDGKMQMQGMAGMKASFGNWSANREGSGTSWQPDSSPMFMKMLPSLGGFEFGTMGTLQAGYVDAGGRRGNKGFFSNSMIMLMGRKEMGGGALGLHLMTSLDPLLNGRRGVPNLFQNTFDVHGVTVSDRKDPHNIFA